MSMEIDPTDASAQDHTNHSITFHCTMFNVLKYGTPSVISNKLAIFYLQLPKKGKEGESKDK